MPPCCGMHSTFLVRLGRIYAAHGGVTLSTAGRHLANHGAFFGRLEAGHTITEARAERVARSISHRWPADLAWPTDIPRPQPAPYAPLWNRPAKPQRDGRDGRAGPRSAACDPAVRGAVEPEGVPVPVPAPMAVAAGPR